MNTETMSPARALSVLRVEIELAECQGPKAVRARVNRLRQVEGAVSALIAERDALAERVAEYVAARDAYEAATRPSNSHGQPKRLANSDPVLLRYREARAALPAGNPTRTEGSPR